jgi:hypothetical protein
LPKNGVLLENDAEIEKKELFEKRKEFGAFLKIPPFCVFDCL